MTHTRSALPLALLAGALMMLFTLASTADVSGFSYVVSHLDQFQTSSGGFVLNFEEPHIKPSLEATSHALFLSSLFGLKKQINSNAVPTYLSSLENGDYGYGKSTGLASDLESVRHAVRSYQHLGLTIPNSGNVAAFVKSLLDSETRLFAPRAGEAGNLKSTALAFQTLEHLGELQRTWVQDLMKNIRSYLARHTNTNGYFSFPEEPSLSTLSANYYGIVLGSFAGVDFNPLNKWANFIASMQSKEDGGFYVSLDKKATSLESTAHAISSLRILQQLQQTKDKHVSFVDSVDTNLLKAYISAIPTDLRSAAQAHLAFALTSKFVDNFDISTTYEVLRSSNSVDTKRVVQGTQLKPLLSVKTFGGVAHAGLDVEAQISYDDSKEITTTKLQWKDSEYYVPDDFFDTSNHLGAMNFKFIIRCYVVGVGEISFEKTDVKQIGYDLTVDAQARLELTGKEYQVGDTVAIGTDFKFGLTLQNQTHDELTSGDFSVIFTVIDSSDIAIFTKTASIANQTLPLTFQYALKNNNIPGGHIGFRFEVANSRGTHTTEVVTYQLALPMIATMITFEGFSNNEQPKYKIGDSVKVSIEPATFPDLRTVYGYTTTDVKGKFVADKRRFVMDVSSPSGTLLRSVVGKSKEGQSSSKYVFEVPITSTLDAIGTSIISFHYVTSSEENIRLSNYDSVFGELYEDSAVFNFTVSSELYMVDVQEKPNAQDYFYGNEISFRFRVHDTISNQYIERGSNEQANIYLSLQHIDEDKPRPFTSAFEAATVVDNGGKKEFFIQWAINPNAVQGAGFLSVVAQDADGATIPLFVEKSKQEPVRYDVNIGGNITVNSKTYSTSETAYEDTAFVVQFTLSCQDKSLRDAQLRCSVVHRDGSDFKPVVALLPASTHDNGEYSVSFTAEHNAVPSGDYLFRCYREIDRKRALEARDSQEKKRRIAEELKQFDESRQNNTETEKTEEKKLKPIEDSLEPLFTISHSHSAPYTGRLPLRTEYIALVVFTAAFFFVSYKKKHYFSPAK